MKHSKLIIKSCIGFVFTGTDCMYCLCSHRAHRASELTVVVLTRPPGCVQVHPDLLTNRSQPSSSKHGTISHHCLFRTIPAAEETEGERLKTRRKKKNPLMQKDWKKDGKVKKNVDKHWG